jgi:hypothetical protein
MGSQQSQLTGRVARIYQWKDGRFMYIRLYSGIDCSKGPSRVDGLPIMGYELPLSNTLC